MYFISKNLILIYFFGRSKFLGAILEIFHFFFEVQKARGKMPSRTGVTSYREHAKTKHDRSTQVFLANIGCKVAAVFCLNLKLRCMVYHVIIKNDL